MFAGGLVALSALFLLQANSQIETGSRFESSTGVAPTGNNNSEQAQILLIATPLVNLRLFDHENDLQVASATRILWRPVPFPDSRPLFLETLTLTHEAHPSRRARWRLSLRATYGEEDYTSLSQQLANQAQLPMAPTIFTATGSAETSWRSSRRTSLTFQLAALHQRAIGTSNNQNATSNSSQVVFFLPTQTTVSATPGLSYALSRLSVLTASTAIAAYDVQKVPNSRLANAPLTGEMQVVTVQPQLGLLETLSRRHQLHWVLGLTYADEVRSPSAGVLVSPSAAINTQPLPWHPVTPLALIELNSLLSRSLAATVTSSASVGTNWYLDPILDTGTWRGAAQVGVNASLHKRWSIGARAAFSTDITGPAIINTSTGAFYPDETILSAEIPMTYRWNNLLIADFGARYVARAPHLSAPQVVWHNQEMWIYVSLFAAVKAPPKPS